MDKPKANGKKSVAYNGGKTAGGFTPPVHESFHSLLQPGAPVEFILDQKIENRSSRLTSKKHKQAVTYLSNAKFQ